MPGKKKKWQALEAAVQQNDTAQVTAVATGLSLGGKDEYYDACVTAIHHGASKALEALLKAGGGFDFSGTKYSAGYMFVPVSDESKECTENKKLARQLIKEAYASSNPESLLPVLYNYRTKGKLKESWNSRGDLSLGDFLNKDAPFELLEVCLKSIDSSAFKTCIDKTGLFSTEKLEFILTLNPGNNAGTLALALIAVAARGGAGDTDKAALLLKHGANADSDGAEALRRAAKNGDQKMVDLLLPHVSLDKHGANYGANLVTQLKYIKADPAIIESIAAATQKAKQKTTAAAQQEGFRRLEDDTLEEVKPLSDGLTLTTLFNFSARQQEKFVTNVAGISSPVTTVSFDDIGEDVIKAKREKRDSLEKPAQSKPRF